MQPTQDALIRSKIPPGYERLATGTILEDGDLLWNFLDYVFQPPIPIWFAEKSQRRVNEYNYAIRKVNQEQTVSQNQAPKPNYGLW